MLLASTKKVQIGLLRQKVEQSQHEEDGDAELQKGSCEHLEKIEKLHKRGEPSQAVQIDYQP